MAAGAAVAALTVAPPPARAACPINDLRCGAPPPRPPKPTDSATLSWSQPGLAADANGGLQETNYDTTNEASNVPVTLNACGSRAISPITSYSFAFDDGAATINTTQCAVTWMRSTTPTFKSVTVTMTVHQAQGPSFSTSTTVRYRDLVIASLGDSAASGQGAQDDGYAASPNCDRSGMAASALAALRVQQTLGPDTDVHFWHLACSGATITAEGSGPFEPNPIDAGGLLSPYSGQRRMQESNPLPPQMQRLAALVAQSNLPVSRLLIQAGANDGGWATVLKQCLFDGGLSWLPLGPGLGDIAATSAESICLSEWKPAVTSAMGNLYGSPGSHFDQLANWIDAYIAANPTRLGTGNIYLTQYYDPLDSLSPPSPVCPGEWFAEQPLRVWGVDEVEAPLQADLAAAAAGYHWHLIDGIRQAFQGHGVCATGTSRWVNSWSDAYFTDKHLDGAWHPNAVGQHAMSNQIYAAISPGLQ
jgi:GDSL-like Lipase/Acylhydrolase family